MDAPYKHFPRQINGRGIRRRHLDADQRRDLAARLVIGTSSITGLRIEQAAQVMEVPVTQVRERLHAWGFGSTNGNGNGHKKETLAEHLLNATPEERREAADALGVSKVWDEMVCPLVTIE
jgi:hypothetical protein